MYLVSLPQITLLRIINTFKSLHIEKMRFNIFRSWLRNGFRDPAVSWMRVFVIKIGGFQLLVIVTKDFVLDAAGGGLYILCFLLIFVKNCLFWIFGVRILNVCFFDLLHFTSTLRSNGLSLSKIKCWAIFTNLPVNLKNKLKQNGIKDKLLCLLIDFGNKE